VPERLPNSAHPSIVPFQNFETANGWIVVSCPKQKFWERLCDAIERPELRDDERFVDFGARGRHRDELLAILEPTFRSRSSAEWLDRLADAGVPSTPVNDVAGALADPQTVARGGVVEIDHPHLGPVRQVASPLRVGDGERPLVRAPLRGEHTEEVLKSLCGYSAERIRDLAAAQVFGAQSGAPEPATAST
jgi:crotonobetainyl-CoA:carnitine CoA-transferase CaiB-like acyl-CoA transferase